MRITNLDKGEAYQLNPDTQLSVERTNPFFNDYGEQTVPCPLPASDHNMRLLDYPTIFGLTRRTLKTAAAISDGDYHAQCVQALLSVRKKGSIETAFYINDGSLYATISDIRLKDIFDGELVKDATGNTITTVQQGIAFCRSLISGTNPDYAIFPVLVDNDSGLSGDYQYDYKVINHWGKDVDMGEGNTLFVEGAIDDNECDFWGATQRTEYVSQEPVTLTAGYYITPFIRCATVLRRIFQHFGYTLTDSLLTTAEPFTKMVFVNNVIDVLVNGTIRITDLLPDVTARTVLDIYRKKFCCEFVADEDQKTVSIVFLNDIVSRQPDADLTGCMTDEPTANFNNAYKRVVIKSEDQVSGSQEESYDNIRAMHQECPTAYFDTASGMFMKDGFIGQIRVRTIVGGNAQPYDTGQDTEPYEVTVPDMMPELCELKLNGTSTFLFRQQFLYIGTYATLNSKLTTTADSDSDTDTAGANNLKPVIAIPYVYHASILMATHNVLRATIGNYDPAGTKLWDYSLLYNGDDGIFSRFWSDADRLYRNALDDVKVTLLLSQQQKSQLPSTAKVVIRNTPFLVNKLKFTLGGKDKPLQTELKSLRIMQPEDVAPTLSQMLPMQACQYRWEARATVQGVEAEEYNNAGADKERQFSVFYPPLPSEAYATGQHYFEQHSYTREPKHVLLPGFDVYTKVTVWLECVHV